jgi:hypothetical protein
LASENKHLRRLLKIEEGNDFMELGLRIKESEEHTIMI